MSTTDIPARVRRVLSDFLGETEATAISGVRDESNLRDGLGLNSLDLVEVTMRLDEEFHVEIDDDAIETVVTVGDVIKVVEKLTGA